VPAVVNATVSDGEDVGVVGTPGPLGLATLATGPVHAYEFVVTGHFAYSVTLGTVGGVVVEFATTLVLEALSVQVGFAPAGSGSHKPTPAV